MIIDIWKENELFQDLKKYNEELLLVLDNLKVNVRNFNWFNPDKQREVPQSCYYPLIHPQQLNEAKWPLILSCANYASLFIINKLFEDRKDILIEDACTGSGYLLYYLSKLGFNNFSAVDNFCESVPELLIPVLESTGAKWTLNNLEANPVACNLIAFGFYPRQIDKENKPFFNFSGYTNYVESPRYFTEETELYCDDRCKMVDTSKIATKNLQYLCDVTGIKGTEMLYVYCKRDKYKEFKEKLEKYEAD